MNKIAERLKYLRNKQSRRAFASALGLTESTLRNYEQGVSVPTGDFLGHICKKLRISPDWLLLGSGPQPQHLPAPDPADSVPPGVRPGMGDDAPGEQIAVHIVLLRKIIAAQNETIRVQHDTVIALRHLAFHKGDSALEPADFLLPHAGKMDDYSHTEPTAALATLLEKLISSQDETIRAQSVTIDILRNVTFQNRP